MSRLMKILAAFSVCLIVIACSSSNTPEATAKAFIEKSYAGNADAALALIHMPQESKPGEREMMQGKIKGMVAEQKDRAERKGGVKEITVQSSEIDKNDPNRAYANVHIQFKDGTDTDDRVRLIKIDGKWKVFL